MEVNHATLKRRASSDNILTKCRRYSSFMPLIQECAFFEESVKVFENLISLQLDVDYYDPSDNPEGECTPLLYAIQNRMHDWTKLLLKNGADTTLACVVKEDGLIKTASDFAWSNGDYDIVVELLRADGPYPEGFDADKLSRMQKLVVKSVRYQIDEFHKQINEDSLAKVSAFAEKHRKTKYAYDINNMSALTVALAGKKFEIYTFLKFKGFQCGTDASRHDELIESINNTKSEKAAISREIQKYAQSSDIFNLLSKSRLAVNNNEVHFENLKQHFEKLYEFEELRPILKIASHKSSTITFDFNNADIGNLDFFNNSSDARGRTFKGTNKILIAANLNSEEVLGILSQELTHFAMLMIYDNNFLPYRKGDNTQKKKFEKVLKASRENKDEEEIIYKAFLYEDKYIAAELIARVPQLIVQNQPEKLSKNRETFAPLFDFYKQEVMKDVEHEAALIEQRQSIQDLNNILGVFHRLKTTKMRCLTSKTELLQMLKNTGNIFVPSRLPELVLSDAIISLKLKDSESIFVELSQLRIEENMELIISAINLNLKPVIFVLDNLPKTDDEDIASVFDQIIQCKLVLVSSKRIDTLPQLFTKHPEVAFTWNDLVSQSKQEVLNFTVDFQDSNYQLGKILTNVLGDDLQEIESWPLEELLDNSEKSFNKLESKFPKLMNIFEPRYFQLPESSHRLSVEDIVSSLEDNKTVIIADVAGMGKTTSAVNLAKKLKMANKPSWIVFFDLKQHTEVFEKNSRNLDFGYILDEMLRFQTEIEKNLFKLYFEYSKSIFVIDGFDEISPNYKDLVMGLMQHVQRWGNRLLVTTRDHLKSDLVNELGSDSKPLTAVKLLPFSEENQIGFLTKFWNQNSEIENKKNLADKARQFLDKFNKSLIQKEIFLEIPLQLFMLADLTCANPGSLNIDFRLLSLYEYFVTNKIDIWIRKGRLSLNDNTKILTKEFNVLLFHQGIAITSVYGKEVSDLLKLPKLPHSLTKEVICRIGFLQMSLSGDFQFAHQTFSDFFVAQILLKSITTDNFTKNVDILHDLLIKVLVETSHYDENVRNFMNEKLEASDEIFHKEELSKKLEQNLNDEPSFGFLLRLVEKKRYNLIALVLRKLELPQELKMKIITQKYPSNYNAVHFATNSFVSWKFLWNCIESCTNEMERKRILIIRGGIHNNSILAMSHGLGEMGYNFVYDIYDKLWSHDSEIINSILDDTYSESASEIANTQEATSSPLEQLWDSIEKYFSLEQQKQLLFGKPCGLFGYLITYQNSGSKTVHVGIQMALKIVKKLFNPVELKNLLKTDWFYDNEVQKAFGSEHSKTILNFFEESIGNENIKLGDFLDKMPEENARRMNILNEYSMISKILDAISSIIEKNEFVASNVVFLVENLVRISASRNKDSFSQFWTFVCKNFDARDQKKLILLKYGSMNTLMAVTRNDDKSTLKYVFEILENIFESSGGVTKQEISNSDDDCLIDVLCHYAAEADSEAFGLLRSFLQHELDNDAQKLLFLQKDEDGNNALMASASNKDKSTIGLVIDTASSLLDPTDFATALESEDENWIVDALVVYAVVAEHEAFEIFWTFLKESLDENDLKLVFLQEQQNGTNAFASCTSNEDKVTIKFVINAAKNLLVSDDLVKALNSEDQNWLVNTLGVFAVDADHEVFEIFWTFLKENLQIKELKLLFLQGNRNGINLLASCVWNDDKSTIKFVVNEARNLLCPDDFVEVLQSKDKNWLVDTVCRFALMSESDSFEIFWSFLKENLNEASLRLVFLQRDRFERNVFMASANNKNLSTIDCVMKTARGLFYRDDFATALRSENQNWLVDSLWLFAYLGEKEAFEIFWSFLQEYLDKDGLKLVFWLKRQNGVNALMASAQNRKGSANECVINTAMRLFDRNDFATALKSEDRNWLVEFLCEYAYFAESEAFELCWAFVQRNLDKDGQKLVFLSKKQNGVNVFMASAQNKSESTIKFIINTAEDLLGPVDFLTALRSENQNWLVGTLCRYAGFTEYEAFGMFLSFLQANLEDNDDQKLVFLQKDQNGLNALMRSAFNEDKMTLNSILKLYKEFFIESDLRDFIFFIFWFNHLRKDFEDFGIHFESRYYSEYLKTKYDDLNLTYFLTFVADSADANALWNIALKHLDKHEIRKQLFAREKDGNNAFSMAAFKARLILLDFLEWFRTNFSPEFKTVFGEKNGQLETIMHIVALNCDNKLSQKFLDLVSSSFLENEIQIMLLDKNKEGKTPLETSRKNIDFHVFRTFTKFKNKYFPANL